MQNLASKIFCIFATEGAYAPYAPCLSTPLLESLQNYAYTSTLQPSEAEQEARIADRTAKNSMGQFYGKFLCACLSFSIRSSVHQIWSL